MQVFHVVDVVDEAVLVVVAAAVVVVEFILPQSTRSDSSLLVNWSRGKTKYFAG